MTINQSITWDFIVGINSTGAFIGMVFYCQSLNSINITMSNSSGAIQGNEYVGGFIGCANQSIIRINLSNSSG
jgi:hypothetical protein